MKRHKEKKEAKRAGDIPAPPAPDPVTGNFYAGKQSDRSGSLGASATFTQHAPFLAPNDAHTLAEIAVSDATDQQIVEVGWHVDPSVNGDSVPHLFVYRWKDGLPSGEYNGGGYQQYSARIRPGMPVGFQQRPQPDDSRTANTYGIFFHEGNWWINYDLEWVGYFPGTIWEGRFTRTRFQQWFGEVDPVAGAQSTCTDMGNGVRPPTAGAARVTGTQVDVTPNSSIEPQLQNYVTDARYYDTRTASGLPGDFAYGGGGAC